MQETKLGTVRIAPSVIATIVSLTASAVEGVAGMSQVSRPPGRGIGRTNTGTAPGVTLQVRNGSIGVELYIIAQPDANLRRLGQALQNKVREALDQMVGIPADQVNVYIEDVTE
ncbi:MAG TPA: Asp23/Gls24 family envelope stress response protein [Chloroflexia bacterium]|nr:Asp23/Gls24 family envelope stress response protein [Chloroflexia bacterium]